MMIEVEGEEAAEAAAAAAAAAGGGGGDPGSAIPVAADGASAPAATGSV